MRFLLCRTKLYEGKLAALAAIKDALQKENDQLREAALSKGHGGGGGSNDDIEAREILGEKNFLLEIVHAICYGSPCCSVHIRNILYIPMSFTGHPNSYPRTLILNCCNIA